MSIITLQEMLEAGVHFGHQTSRWNPKMAPYIFGERNGIHIINLEKTLPLVQSAYDFVNKQASQGGEVLFVATKKQAQDVVIEAAQKCGMHHMTHRWLGGTLTNFRTVKGSIERLRKLEPMVMPRQAQKKIAEMTKETTVMISEFDLMELQALLANVPGAELTEGELNQLRIFANAETLDHEAIAAFLEPKSDRLRKSTTLSKKELLTLSREYEKLNNNLGGIRTMKDLPKAIFVVDTNKEHIAMAEARRLGIKVIAIVDTNTDPSQVDFPIPANDDSIRSIQLFANLMAQAVNDGRNFKGVEVADTQEMAGVEIAEMTAGNNEIAPEASASAQ